VKPEGAVRVLLMDDHALIRAMLTALLANQPGFHVVSACGDVAEAVAAATTHRPDVVLMDLNLPGPDGAYGAARLRQVHPAGHVLILTGTAYSLRHEAALEAGACRVLTKDIGIDQLTASIRRCADPIESSCRSA
jgi:DNA-binding NarL/FixJ family response regulator